MTKLRVSPTLTMIRYMTQKDNADDREMAGNSNATQLVMQSFRNEDLKDHIETQHIHVNTGLQNYIQILKAAA